MTNINKDSTGTDTSMTEKAKEAAGSASEQVKAHAKDVADTVATEAGNYAGQAKDAAADEVKNVSSALRRRRRNAPRLPSGTHVQPNRGRFGRRVRLAARQRSGRDGHCRFRLCKAQSSGVLGKRGFDRLCCHPVRQGLSHWFIAG